MNEPKILFCDEPTGNLDGDTATAMVKLILDLKSREEDDAGAGDARPRTRQKNATRSSRLKGGLVISDEMI